MNMNQSFRWPVLMLLCCLFWATTSSNLMAQKIAVLDADAVLKAMPDYKRIQGELETYQKQLLKQLDEEKRAIAKYYADVIEKVKVGALSPAQQQEAEAELQRRQETLQEKTNDADRKLVEREKSLSKPMYDKFEAGIKAIAKSNGYMYILDKKLCAYAAGIDATDKLKKHLGAK